jgi:DNA-binding CsgD family transcriptional regulator
MESDRISWEKWCPKDQKHIYVTLPRVQWLERDPEYRAPAYVEPKQPERKKDARKKAMRPLPKSGELTLDQFRAFRLYSEGMTLVAIGVEMNRSTNAVRKLLNRASEKQGIELKWSK